MQSQTRNAFLFAFIASIVLCGLIGIYCFLVGSMGIVEGRILGTTGVVGAASILALASAIPWEQKRWQPIGPLGLVVVAAALVQSICAIWIDRYADDEGLIKALFVTVTLAVSLPHIGLLSLARLRRGYEWVRIATILSIAALAGLVSFLLVFEVFDEIYGRLLGTTAILDVCGTITVPILHRVSSSHQRDSIQSAAMEVMLTCPRCDKTANRPVGQSKCPSCGLGMNIEIDEEHCANCGYVLFGIVSAVCPECGTPIARRGPASEADSLTAPGTR